MGRTLRTIARRLGCSLWGHVVDNHVFRRAAGTSRRCRCGTPYLAEDGTTTHVRHTLSCFLRHHTYERLSDRDGLHEYVCVRCGHPLAYPADADPFADRGRFAKKVRYLCGLFGHRARPVASRNGFTEYACHCGHSFLKEQRVLGKIHHPFVCVLRVHQWTDRGFRLKGETTGAVGQGALQPECSALSLPRMLGSVPSA